MTTNRSSRSRRTRWALALTAAAVVATSAGLQLAGAASVDTEPSYAGCLKTTGTGAGTVVAVAPGTAARRACLSTEQPIRLSGGDITAVGAGTGLRAVSDSLGVADAQGSATLDLAPSYRLPQGCSDGQRPSKKGSVWACVTPDVPLPAAIYASAPGASKGDAWGPVGNSDSVLKGLDLPAGSWAVTAKIVASVAQENDVDTMVIHCRLDFTGQQAVDEVSLLLDTANMWDHGRTSLTLVGATTRTTPFRVAVICRDNDFDMVWSDLRIMAVPTNGTTTVNL